MAGSAPVFHLAHKIELVLNDKERTCLAKAAGTARFAYNWALDAWKKQYEECKKNPKLKKPTEASLRKQLNAIKGQEFPWMLEVTKCAPQMAIMQLGDAFKNFFAGRTKYPQFRIKGLDDRFTLTNDQFRVVGSKIHIPHLKWVEMREELRFKGKITSATISRKADKWFVSLTVELQDLSHLKPAENQGVVVPRRRFAPIGDTTIGVDLGVAALATLSTGEVVEGPKPLKRLMRKVRKLSKSIARKEKGSANRQKEKRKLAKIHAKIANIRKDGLHKLTTDLTSRFHTVVIEDLNVSGMIKNRKLARAISDMGFYEFRRQLTYKAAMRGGEVIVADRFFPSSKLCSVCGSKLEELSLSVRKWTCPGCGVCHDRDVNAALNLKNSVKITACSAV